jgi:hypothetical protein
MNVRVGKVEIQTRVQMVVITSAVIQTLTVECGVIFLEVGNTVLKMV